MNNNNIKEEVVCPICKSKAEKECEVDKQKVANGLESIFNEKIPLSILKIQYSLYICTNCTLSFSWPLIQGDSDFYNFLTTKKDYYTTYRPEYEIIWNILKEKSVETKVLDVGCGDGSFLFKTLNMPNIKAMGIDTTLSSVEKSLQSGVETYQSMVEDFEKKDFDIIVSFHCLEHVNDPVVFMSEIVKRLKEKGTVFISTPYSPLSYEYFWFHPLNHPPHHTLRFNKKSYEALAKELNLKIKFHNFEKMSFKSHVRSCFSYGKFGNNKNRSLYLQMLISPVLSLKSIFKVYNREKIDGRIAGNNILVEFQK